MSKRLGLASLAMAMALFGMMGSVSAEGTGKDAATDFGSGYDAADWQMAATPDDNALSVADGELVFAGAQDNSYFGPQGTYSTFAASFDIHTFEGNSSWIGLTFGNPQPDTFFGEPEPYLLLINNDSIMMLGKGTTETVEWENPEQRWLPGDYALAVKEEPLNVKVVYDGSKVEVYYKLASEAADLMAAPRAVFPNLPEVSGYVNFTTSGNADIQGWFSLDNIAVSGNPQADLSAIGATAATPEPTESAATATPEPTPSEASPAEETPAAGEETPAATDKPTEAEDSDNDRSLLYIILAVAGLAVVVIAVIAVRRNSAKK
ncbi:hypothetical protein B1748_30320 [Paenibacillus sp. MY03]|uniref:hypothetical protein n=1 Tax=Paenibacillus sp. MY03 TaxID=302980 RepID=UPI000B3CC969|nr:hypothetical protein [Paenibacillus sp. MY03]OUS69804.1 hypothetical protein B1748_30320 [Paenibacillus sp. MY03]